ncbi:doublecortin domain-containing protein 2-like [Brachyhypopomus gauderio]|uniref:doublecortin domain-containing protein 2-like n=1 Tax=Brachyhypopomus gauderio TaxID=698409 RepID=UPI0040410A87
MNGEKHSFLSQPVVKNIYVFRNGDPYYEARRLVINEKRVSNFETLLRELTGGVQARFGAVRNIYTPRGGHRVDSLDMLHNGEQYVAAGREKFKKLDYLQIETRKKRMQQTNGTVKPVPQSRITVAARFLEPIKEPCAIFILANGDVLNPAVRFLVPNRGHGQFERILEMITEKMGLRVLGGVRSLCTTDGVPITDGKDLENGQWYVAVGRDKFKRLPYADLLFTRPMGVRRVIRSKAASLPPIYGFRRQNGDGGNHLSRSTVGCGEAQASPPVEGVKPRVSSLIREISQARLVTLRKKRSGLSVSLSGQDSDDQKPDLEDEEGVAEPPAEESAADGQKKAGEDEEAEPEEETGTDINEEAEPVREEEEEEEERGEDGVDAEEEEKTGEDAEEEEKTGGDIEEEEKTGGDIEEEEKTGGDIEEEEKTGGDIEESGAAGGDDVVTG